MALHRNFPPDPYAVLEPDLRWFPGDESLRNTDMKNLIAPLVAQIRRRVKEFRDDGYAGASETSRSLLRWWFLDPHLTTGLDNVAGHFQYYFAQREAIESIIYLCDVVGARNQYDLMRFDATDAISDKDFPETWRRYVVKMAMGSGKTKVMSLVLAWSYYHKLYEPNSELSRNFLVIAPNIIVLDRLYKDFQGLRIFSEDPVLPSNGYDGRNWRDDFQITLHKQDEVQASRPTGNIYLTNIHRVYLSDPISSSFGDENTTNYYLGKQASDAAADSKVDLGIIVRDVDELLVINDEAHHIHDKKLAWFQSIQDIHNQLLQKGVSLSLQVDLTATPKHNNGAIFAQTVSDYPLVEAVSQNVVKRPVLPDAASRTKLCERQSVKFIEKYADYLNLGVIEWRKAYEHHRKLGKKGILFVMTDDTKNCDETAAHLESRYPDLKGAVLTIHTKNNGEIAEASSGKKKQELDQLRKQANEIDDEGNPHKAIVSVIMLKEGWDVRNVTTIVGLRSYSAKSNILPEQTLGRGLRKMYEATREEYLSVIGTDAFMDFVESIQAEGVVLERVAMGEDAPSNRLIVEVDRGNPNKNIDALDIEIPLLSPHFYREYGKLDNLNVRSLVFEPVNYQFFGEEECREIVFRDIASGDVSHRTILSAGIMDSRSVVGYFVRMIMRELHMLSKYDVLFGKVGDFIQHVLFGRTVDLASANTLRNLAEPIAARTVIEAFKKSVNELTVGNRDDTEIQGCIKLRQTKTFAVKEQDYIVPKKSVFNKIIGDVPFELEFAKFLERCPDVDSYAKNYFAIDFKLDYIKMNGDIANYYPDFIVRTADGRIVVVELKGRVDEDVPSKMARLKQWCEECGQMPLDGRYDFVFVDDEGFRRFSPKAFGDVLSGFLKYQ